MADKSRADLEYELERASQAKMAAEDRLAVNRLAPLAEELQKAEAAYAELQTEYDNAVETRDALTQELDEALTAVEDIETLSEEILGNDSIIVSIREQIDLNNESMNELMKRIEELKAGYDVHAEELEMARVNNEHTALLERRLQIMESEFNNVVDELRSREEAGNDLAAQLQEADEARESVEYMLEGVEDRSGLVTNLEAQIADLENTIEDRRCALETYWDNIEEMKESVETLQSEVDSDTAIVAEQTAALESLNEQLTNYVEPEAPRNEALDSVVAKLSEATCYEDVYALNEELGRLGFTIQTTTGGRAVLCRTNEGKIVADAVLEDFVFVGDPTNIYEHFTDGTVDKIVGFVTNNAGSPVTCESKEPIMIVNENKQLAVDILAEAVPKWGKPGGFREPVKPAPIPPIPGKSCPRCKEQSVIAARGAYNCTKCGWRGGKAATPEMM